MSDDAVDGYEPVEDPKCPRYVQVVVPRGLHLEWNGTEWVDSRCGCRYHPDDDNGSHNGAPHVHRCLKHRGRHVNPREEASEAHNERMREEGREQGRAEERLAVVAWLRSVASHGEPTWNNARCIELGNHFPAFADALAKREAAAEERGFERGRALYQNAWTEVGAWQSRCIDAQRERDALRADVARRERAAAKKALEDACRDLPAAEVSSPEERAEMLRCIAWLREQAALQGDTEE